MKKQVFLLASLILLMVIFLARNHDSTKPVAPVEERASLKTNLFRKSSRFQRTPSISSTHISEELETPGARLVRMSGSSNEYRLNENELADYVRQNRTNSLSLVTAFEATRNREFLKQAATNFPNDPFVQAKILMHDVFPEDRQKWIEAFKKSAPENSWPHFLTAQEMMKNGDAAGALKEVFAGKDKKFNDYTRESVMGLEEAYLSAGRAVAESKFLGASEILLPQLAPLKKLGVDLADQAAEFGKAGDQASQQALLEGAWHLGTSLRESGPRASLLGELVGLAVQNIALNKWPQEVHPPFLSHSAAEEASLNKSFRSDLRSATRLFDPWINQAPGHEIISYFDRSRTFGERNAMEWLKARNPELIQPSPGSK